MAFVPAEKVAQIEIRMGLDGQRVENVVYAQAVSAWDQATLISLGEDVIDWWSTTAAPLYTTSQVLREIFLTDLTSATATAVSVVPDVATEGTLGFEPLPNNCAIAISFRTASRGRSARGRNYISGIPTDNVSGNRVEGTFLDDWASAYVGLKEVIEGHGATMVVVSRRHNKVNRSAAVMFPVTTFLFVDNVIDSQRRRLPGRGT